MTTHIPDPRPAMPPLPPEVRDGLVRFLAGSRFAERGGIVTDLDGTAVHEREGRVLVAPPVAEGLRTLAEQGRPVALNTLRFPRNVIDTFGRVWSSITNDPLPLVSLNGSVLGYLVPTERDVPAFEEIATFPLSQPEVDDVARGLETLLADGIEDIVVFHYARDWRDGERVWTPRAERVPALREKYRSAAIVEAGTLASFHASLVDRGAVMLSVLVDIPQDRRMAYQHADPNRFVTTAGVDKLSGARELATRLGFSLEDAVGCGDTPMDRFLSGVGLSLHVGPLALEFLGRVETIRLADPFLLGAALFELAALAGKAPAP